jgi:Zinc carboxypeptidase
VRKLFAITVVLGSLVASAAPALATPVATNDAQYAQLGRVFPDPLAGCVATPCNPDAQGNQAATQFIQYPEMIDGLKYLNSKKQWRQFLEVLPLDGKLGEGSGTSETAAFPGNNLGRFEFTPKKNYHSAGLPQTGNSRKVSDLIMARVTDESVPDKGKKRYAVSLSIHGIERAGAEGGTRWIEDYVTAITTGKLDKPILPPGSTTNIPTFRKALQKAIVYVFYPNPDGWRRGDVSEGGVFFQRYNGNGMDVNRDWPDVGFSFRPYSPLSEPESRGFAGVLRQIGRRTKTFDQGADLHGQLEADALSYTLLPHGVHNYAKSLRIQGVAEAIHGASEKALAWSPIIQPNDAPRGGGAPCAPTGVGGDACAKIYGQTWGTVYDTINYTTTGAMGDWFDSPKGLDANGIDNEMSFSHLDKNIVFDPHTEQLHVDGNKALINAQVTRMLSPKRSPFDVAGAKGFVPNARLERKFQQLQNTPPTGTKPQADITADGFADPTQGGQTIFPIDVKRSKTIFNGGMRVEITNQNAQGIGPGAVSLTIQCKDCDPGRHPGEVGGDGWVTVTQDFNQSPAYLQAGVVATVNEPQATNGKGKKVQWRAVVGQGGLSSRMVVHFTSGPAGVGGETGSPKARPPRLLAYDIANTDFYKGLNGSIPGRSKDFHAVSPKRVADGAQALSNFDSLAISDNPFPGTSTAKQRARWYAALAKWVKRGGNLVLTDGALRALPSLTSIPASAVKQIKVYVGQVAFAKDSDGDTLGDPLNKGVAIPGARFNLGMRRQTYEPVPIGFRITDEQGNDETHSPQWQVSREAWEKAGGRTAATSVQDESVGGSNDYDATAYGQLKLGKGVIRILGAALPQPTEKEDHDFGLSPHSATYTTYILMRNLLKPVTTRCHDFKRPRAFIDRGSVVATRQGISMRGTAADKGCLPGGKGKISRVRVAIATRKNTGGKNRCRFAKPNGGLTRPRNCKSRLFLPAKGTDSWTFDYHHPLPNGRYTLRARPIDSVGNLALRTRKSTHHLKIR